MFLFSDSAKLYSLSGMQRLIKAPISINNEPTQTPHRNVTTPTIKSSSIVKYIDNIIVIIPTIINKTIFRLNRKNL